MKALLSDVLLKVLGIDTVSDWGTLHTESTRLAGCSRWASLHTEQKAIRTGATCYSSAQQVSQTASDVTFTCKVLAS